MKLILPKKKNFDIKFSFFWLLKSNQSTFFFLIQMFFSVSLSPLLNLKTKILN